MDKNYLIPSIAARLYICFTAFKQFFWSIVRIWKYCMSN